MNSVQFSNLNKPGSDAFHDFPTCLQPPAPVSFPLKQVARVQGVGSQFEQAAKLAGRCCWPERKLLHKRGAFRVDERFQLMIKFGEFRVVLNSIKRRVIALVSLVLPDMDCI